MSIITENNPYPHGSQKWLSEEHYIYDPLIKSFGCFFCSRDLGPYPIVHWNGAALDIFLHPACAGKLAGHLAKDSHLAQVIS